MLRGETSHYDYVASETARGIQLAQLDTGVPMVFCVLTCDTLEQAIDRAGLKGGNKGYEAGLGAIEMAHLSRKLSQDSHAEAPNSPRNARFATPPMTLRHKSREFALQMLFEWDMTRQEPARVESLFWKSARAADADAQIREPIFEGAVAEAGSIDGSSRSSRKTGGSNGSRPLTGASCGWRSTNFASAPRRRKS